MKSLVITTMERVAAGISVPEMYKMIKEIYRVAAPMELLAIYRHPQTPAEMKKQMAASIELMLGGEESAQAVRYRRRAIAEHVTLFTSAEPSPRLLIGFCGRSNLIFMPTALYLQMLKGRADLAVFGDPQQTGFTNGVYAYAPTFEQAMEKAVNDLDLARYDDIRTFGASGGGAPAIAAGQMLGGRIMVSFGGRSPTRTHRYGDTPGALAMEQHLSDPSLAGRAFAVFSEGNAEDSESGRHLGELGAITVVPIPGHDQHNVVHRLHLAGDLEPLFVKLGLISAV